MGVILHSLSGEELMGEIQDQRAFPELIIVTGTRGDVRYFHAENPKIGNEYKEIRSINEAKLTGIIEKDQ